MSSKTPFLKDLDTTSVNLWSLLRKLTEQQFIGRVHVELQDYSADIFLDGSNTPLVREIDRAANTDTLEQGALHRVVLRTRETPGLINVFAGSDEATAPTINSPEAAVIDEISVEPLKEVIAEPAVIAETPAVIQPETVEEVPSRQPDTQSDEVNLPVKAPSPQVDEGVYRSGSYDDWPALLVVTGELIAAIERGVDAAGGDFLSLFERVRLELADDYVFLDPMAKSFRYSQGQAALEPKPAMTDFVQGLSEALRRTIDRIAVGERTRRVRERVALEMFPIARKRSEILQRSGLGTQLDRIAGTKVM